MDGEEKEKLRLGFVGGGPGSLIGPIHVMASTMDQHFEIVAGTFSRDYEKTKEHAESLGIDLDRAYRDYKDMAEREAQRDDGVDMVAILSPNDNHVVASKAFLEEGIHVLCEKPLATNAQEAFYLSQFAKDKELMLATCYNYSGFPMIRQARAMVEKGDLGKIRMVNIEMPQSYLASTSPQSTGDSWRQDPKRVGPSLILMDLATHLHHLMLYVSGLEVDEVLGETSTLVDGGPVDDNVSVLIRFKEGARGLLWTSASATGNEHGMRIRVFGDKASLDWFEEEPNHLIFKPLGKPHMTYAKGGPSLYEEGKRGTRMTWGHPEGYIEAFANIYSDIALFLEEEIKVSGFPDGEVGAKSILFSEKVLESSSKGAWVKIENP